MDRIILFVLNWIDFFLHIYIHITATVNAVILVAKKSNNNHVTAQDMILKRRSMKPTTSNKRVRKNSPFNKIPNEILLVMFQFMNDSDLYHCSTVTKHWNELTTPILWKSPIPKNPILIHDTGFPLHMTRYGHAVKSLDLSLIAPHVNDTVVRYIMRTCPHLQSLNLSNCRITNDCLPYLHSHINTLVLQNCRYITDTGLTLLKCGLETLHLGGCHRLTDHGIISLVTATGRTIRRMNLSDCRVTGKTLHAIARVCGPRLQWLDISRTNAIRHSDIQNLVYACPNISRLNLSMKKQKTLQELHNQLSMTTSRHYEEEEEVEELSTNTVENPLHELIDLLHQLNIRPNLTDSSAQHQQALMEQQRKKDLVSNKTIECMAMHLKKLEHLNISYWTCLNDKAVHMLSTHSHCLTYLNLIGCQSVTSKVLKYLSDLCERKSTCITLTDLMISPRKEYSSYESNTWSSSSSVSSTCSSDHYYYPTQKRSSGVIKA